MYKILKRMIERENYKTKEDIKDKISILYINDTLTKEEYEELILLLS
jgi:hypothetical protein